MKMSPQPKKKKVPVGKKIAARSERRPVVVMVSGGFDPLHAGHVRMFREAKKLGDQLIVVINNDHWLRKKKGIVFMPQEERKELIEGIKSVDKVLLSGHRLNPSDMSVSSELRKIKPNIFANGGDRNKANAADPTSSLYKDINTCKELGIEIVFNVGPGGKIQSSSWLLANFVKATQLKEQQTPPQVS